MADFFCHNIISSEQHQNPSLLTNLLFSIALRKAVPLVFSSSVGFLSKGFCALLCPCRWIFHFCLKHVTVLVQSSSQSRAVALLNQTMSFLSWEENVHFHQQCQVKQISFKAFWFSAEIWEDIRWCWFWLFLAVVYFFLGLWLIVFLPSPALLCHLGWDIVVASSWPEGLMTIINPNFITEASLVIEVP